MTLGQGPTLAPGQVVGGHYKIIRPLAAGNFGQTYLAEDLHAMGTKCAVKRLSFVTNSLAAFEKAKELFHREASVLLQLSKPQRHDQIPRFLACFDENQEFYLVQELIEGHPLSDELEGGRQFQEDAVADLLEDVLTVLKFIHSQGIIHRDIKPANLMRRTRDGRLVLVDFGAVKDQVAQSAGSSLQKKPTLIYTEGYAPREQCQGDPQPNSDIYALGMTAIQALTGVDPSDLPKDARTGEVLWRNQAPVSNELAQILDKMVRHNWKSRYQSADDALNAVQKYKRTLMVSPRQRQPTAIPQAPLPAPSAPLSAPSRRSSQLPGWFWYAILTPLVTVIAFAVPFLVKSIQASDSSGQLKTPPGPTSQPTSPHSPEPTEDDIFKRPPGTP